MSRSYKKHPICKHPRHGSNKEARVRANRRYRRILNRNIEAEEIAPHAKNDYQKFNDSWNIADYISYESIEEAKARYASYCEKAKTFGWSWYEKMAALSEEEFLKKYWYPYFYRR